MKPKLVIINRAVPGSGKTTALKTIEIALKEDGLDIQKDFATHSTDSFFMVGEKYNFDVKKLNDYHKQNEEEFEFSLNKGISVVVCDNTNILPWQCEIYTNLARKYGYKIAFLNIEPKSIEEHVETQKVTPKNPGAHQVSKDILERNIEEWRIYNDLFKNGERTHINPLRHRHFKWDDENMCRKDTGEMAKHFDCDYLISLPSWWDKDGLKKEIQEIIQDQIPWRFDLVIHTYDKMDTISLIYGLRTLSANKHLILCPKNTYSGFIENIKSHFLSSGEIEICEVCMFDRIDIENLMRHRAIGKVAFHLSGGSKVMFLAGANIAKVLNANSFVIDSDKFNMLLLNDCRSVRKIDPLSQVNDFLVANTYGLNIIKDTDTHKIRNREKLTNILFKNKGLINDLMQEIHNKIKQDKNTYEIQAQNFTISKQNLTIEYNKESLKLILAKNEYEEIKGNENDILSYIIGGWFEEYIYLQLIPLVQNGYIYDLQINTKLTKKERDYQEFDIVFTNGYRLFVVECKSGGVKSESIEKLANIRQRYGGLDSVCIVATAFEQNKIIHNKIKENGLYFVRDNYRECIKEIINLMN